MEWRYGYRALNIAVVGELGKELHIHECVGGWVVLHACHKRRSGIDDTYGAAWQQHLMAPGLLRLLSNPTNRTLLLSHTGVDI